MNELTLTHNGKLQTQSTGQPRWQRFILLTVLGYEGIGALLGSIFLIAAPDGSYMDIPVEIMHGVFHDFMIPGIILFVLGILNTTAFVSVLLRSRSDWLIASLALGGMYIWFVIEILILQELHWLHAMWGIPVLIGWTFVIPLIALRHPVIEMQRTLLTLGIISSLWYIIVNIFVPFQYANYSPITQTVSELSAIDAPTRVLCVVMISLYPLLYAAFGWGVLQSAGRVRSLSVAGTLIIIYCILMLYWPPMHMREVIGSGGGTLTDTLHIVWSIIAVLFLMLMMGFGAAALGRSFRLYTIFTFVVFIIFGVLTGLEGSGIQNNLPTPWIGVWERINIGVFMIWVVVFAIALLKNEKSTGLITGNKIKTEESWIQ